MIIKFNDDVQKVLLNSKKEMIDLKHPYIGTEHLVLSILKFENFDLTRELGKLGITYKRFYDEVVKIVGVGDSNNKRCLYTPLLKRILNITIDNVHDTFKDIELEDLFFALIDEGEGVAIRVILSLNVNLDDLYSTVNRDYLVKNGNKKKLLSEFGDDLNLKALADEVDPVVGRDNEINRVIEILLRREKNNSLLIGDAGVGKTAIVEELARLLAKNKVPARLKGCRIVSISMASLVAGTKYRGEFEERVTKLLKEAEEDKQIILFIDEIHTLVGAGGAEGAIDASNILKPSLARGKIKIIGATTIDEYKKCIAGDKALSRRFQIVKVEEPSKEIVRNILCTLKPLYERHHGVLISDEVIDSIVMLSNKYIYDRKQPDKAIDILDEVCSRVANLKDDNSIMLEQLIGRRNELMAKKRNFIINQEFDKAIDLSKKENILNKNIKRVMCNSSGDKKSVSIDDVNTVISSISLIPISDFTEQFMNVLFRMKHELSDLIYCQNQAIDILMCATESIKLGINSSNRPYSFLFAGPTGVGKTYLAKEYAKILGYNLVKIDMSEFREEHSISKILGAPSGYVGYNDYSNVLEDIRNKPYSVVLLDEFEKAHPSIRGLFLQIMDDGQIKDARGNVVKFDNCIIILTSNVGFDRKTIGFNEIGDTFIVEHAKEMLTNEIVNRINNVIAFKSLDQISVVKIIKKEFNKRKDALDRHGIRFKLTEKRINELIKLSDYQNFGARHIEMVINDMINKYVMNTFENQIYNKVG